jgi:hypothetical protein
MTVIFLIGEPTRQENNHAVDPQVTPIEGVDQMGFNQAGAKQTHASRRLFFNTTKAML